MFRDGGEKEKRGEQMEHMMDMIKILLFLLSLWGVLFTVYRFGKVKICFDVTLIAISFLSSLLFFHGLQGIGIGTVISALAVGPIVSFFNRHLPLTFSSDSDGLQNHRHFWHCQLHG